MVLTPICVYIGYPVQWAQMECLKLISSPKFPDKRIGYLGLTLLLDETVDVLTLVTNSLSMDLNHPSPYVSGLALVSLGNVGSREMLRDLSSTLGKMLSDSSDPFIRKKAILCAGRMFRKEPDLIEDFIDKVINLLNEKEHSVLMAGVTVLTEIAENHNEYLKKLRSKCVSKLTKILKGLIQGGHPPEYDVSGIDDPFLQIRILKLLGILGADSSSASEAMSDVLAQVSGTDGSKNTGNAILYECVRTIMSIEADTSLRVLAINILGRFLSTRDNNIRYVALHTLGTVISVDTKAVQRHKATIVACLKDPDISIRTRALELIYDLFNSESIESLSKEVINYLELAPRDQVHDICARLAEVISNIQVSRKWYIDTLIDILSVSGEHAPSFVWEHAITLIGQPESASCRPYILHKLFVVGLRKMTTSPGLINVAVWSIGEYGDLLLLSPPGDAYEESVIRTPDEIVDMMEKIQTLYSTTNETKGMVLNADLKLKARIGSKGVSQRLEELINLYSNSANVELQTRSTEYANILDSTFSSKHSNWLAPMPVPNEEIAKKMYAQFASKSKDESTQSARSKSRDADDENGDDNKSNENGEDNDEEEESKARAKVSSKSNNNKGKRSKEFEKNDNKKSAASNALIDLESLFGGGGSTAPSSTQTYANNNSGSSGMDLLSGLGAMPSSTTATNTTASLSSGNAIDDLLGSFSSVGMNGGNSGSTSFVGYEKDRLKVVFDVVKDVSEAGAITVTANYTNTNSVPLTEFVFQAAVPK